MTIKFKIILSYKIIFLSVCVKGVLARIKNMGAIFRWEDESEFSQLYKARGSTFHITNVLSTIIACDVDPFKPLNPVNPDSNTRDASTQTPAIQTATSIRGFKRQWSKMCPLGETVTLPVYRVIEQGRYTNTVHDGHPGQVPIYLNLDRRASVQVGNPIHGKLNLNLEY